MKVLITGACGLVGSACVLHFGLKASSILGIDNNSRMKFFGPSGDTRPTRDFLLQSSSNLKIVDLDIRDQHQVFELFESYKPDLIIHCAAQPAHDLAAKIIFEDFAVNATGSLNLLEATRQFTPAASFCYISTNKVYGDGPNRIERIESAKRWDFAAAPYVDGIDESFPIDQSLHTLFGVSKLSADLLVQEYGSYFGLNTASFRAGCITGRLHAGVELHGFLSHLVKVARRSANYVIYGYHGKQVRDQIHALDVASAVDHFHQRPQAAAVFNLGGGKRNSVSVLEAIERVEQSFGIKMNTRYDEQHRIGDHLCYYSNTSKFQKAYPDWQLKFNLDAIFEDLLHADPI